MTNTVVLKTIKARRIDVYVYNVIGTQVRDSLYYDLRFPTKNRDYCGDENCVRRKNFPRMCTISDSKIHYPVNVPFAVRESTGKEKILSRRQLCNLPGTNCSCKLSFDSNFFVSFYSETTFIRMNGWSGPVCVNGENSIHQPLRPNWRFHSVNHDSRVDFSRPKTYCAPTGYLISPTRQSELVPNGYNSGELVPSASLPEL